VKAMTPERIEVLALLDPQEGGWRLDPSTCDPAWAQDFDDANRRTDDAVMLADGQVFYAEYRVDPDDPAGRWRWDLVRVVVPDR
jgi:hypothetical protein